MEVKIMRTINYLKNDVPDDDWDIDIVLIEI